jgi:hypothetical protein
VVPAPELFHGVRQLVEHQRAGHRSLLLGEIRDTGWWYFFPVALLVKSPIPLLLLALCGAGAMLAGLRRPRGWQRATPFAVALCIVLATMPSSVNIGVRHVLPVFALLALCAGLGVQVLWRARRAAGLGRVLATLLLIWHCVASVRAHPEYLAYFNELADDRPEQFLVDSDLDWGQGLERLARTLESRGISRAWVGGWGSTDLARVGLHDSRSLPRRRPVTGWVAVRLQLLEVEGGFEWLKAHTPEFRVGGSVAVYHIPPKRGFASSTETGGCVHQGCRRPTPGL